MKHIKLFEEFVSEGKSFQFTIDYNTDEDDVEYIQNILMDAGVDAIAEPGTFDDEMVIKALNAVELRKAKKAIQADGFEINESFVDESSIGDIHIMAQEADSFTGFRKAFMDEYGKPKSVKELKSLEAWLQTIWNEKQANEGLTESMKVKDFFKDPMHAADASGWIFNPKLSDDEIRTKIKALMKDPSKFSDLMDAMTAELKLKWK